MTATMRHLLTSLAITLIVATGIAAASAQVVPQVSSPVPPVPQPPPPPPPSMAVPTVPKMDAPPPRPVAPKVDRRSFNQRFDDCQMDAVAVRLDSGERASYARACANQL